MTTHQDVAALSAKLDAFAELAYKAKSAEVAACQNLPYSIDEQGPRERLQTAKDALIQSFSSGHVPETKTALHQVEWVRPQDPYAPPVWTAVLDDLELTVCAGLPTLWMVGPRLLPIAKGPRLPPIAKGEVRVDSRSTEVQLRVALVRCELVARAIHSQMKA